MADAVSCESFIRPREGIFLAWMPTTHRGGMERETDRDTSVNETMRYTLWFS